MKKKTTKRRARPQEPWDPTQLTFHVVRHDSDRIRALAKREGLTINSLLYEAVHIHLHRLESRGDPKLRRKSVCWRCGKLIDDAATDGTKGARRRGKRQKRCQTIS